jgi:hypothetical protein
MAQAHQPLATRPSTEERQLSEAFAELDRQLAPPAGAREAAVDPQSLCQRYNQAKPTIERVLGLVENIPIPLVRQIAGIVRFLMGVADTACAVVG